MERLDFPPHHPVMKHLAHWKFIPPSFTFISEILIHKLASVWIYKQSKNGVAQKNVQYGFFSVTIDYKCMYLLSCNFVFIYRPF